ncbi:MAG: lipoprotein-releasing ABC transporter permease subunit [Syntrophales bacterium]|nr:lipoprotein-releasing ABC transporter permease subunit [Syntrophales bacterium]
MGYELFVSIRYLRAKRKQTFISINTVISTLGIFLGVAALIIVLSVMAGFETELRNKILGINSHVLLMRLDGNMEHYHHVMDEISGLERVVASTPFVYGQAMVRKGKRVTGVVLRGIAPESALSVINVGKMIEGDMSFLADDDNWGDRTDSPPIVLGKELAGTLGARYGDEVEVLLPMGIPTPMGNMPRIQRFSVAGVFESGFYEYDSTLIFLSLADSKRFLNTGNAVTGIQIRIDSIYKAGEVAEAIEARLGYPYWARTWMEMNRNLFAALKLERTVMFIILSLIVLVAAFNIIITLIMSVMEKTGDIAILKSMGATRASIMKIFMIQGLLVGAVGTFLGCVAGIVVSLNIKPTVAFIERLFGITALPNDVYYLSSIPSQVSYPNVALIVLVTLGLCFAASIYPAWSASRLDPAEALRYE